RARWDELPLARDPRRRPVEAVEDVMVTCGLPGPTGPPLDEVTAPELPALLEAGGRVIDLREEHELAGGMLRGAEHLPMGEVLARAGAGAGAADSLEGAVLYCAAGSRSGSVQRSLAGQGIRVRSLRGGFGAVEGTAL